ncbi:hypothetical protein BKA61DRAFT_583142 [Leptodontidium sp. MPI-SDFR-AT-0119]|nr:hypothetical protein BKA61DRAFT_583142 [Leptodontidium sp. MPI-SDFR-AT-0119]
MTEIGSQERVSQVVSGNVYALDNKTERHVVDSLLGKSGILKTLKTTVFLITNSGYYIKSVGIANAIYLVSCAAAYSVFLAFTQYWLKWWTESPPGHTWFYMAGYLLIAFIAWSTTSAMMRRVVQIGIAPQSGRVLHERLLSAIYHRSAPLSYYSTTDTGAILNRFGQDIQLVDKQLPPALNNIIIRAVSRLRSAIVQTPVEDQAGEDLVPPESWPARGERGGVGKCGATSPLCFR